MTLLKYIFILALIITSSACLEPTDAANTVKANNQQETPSAENDANKPKTEAPHNQTVATEEFTQKILSPDEIISPLESIKKLDQMIEAYHLGQELTPEEESENRLLKQKIIKGTFDIQELCRLSLGKHWEEITKDQQQEFVKLMTTLLETKAIFSKEQLKGSNKYYTIVYKKETYDDAEKTKATIFTDMNVPKEKITLNITYKMLTTPYGWKIFDVIVDDASLLANYKFQFDRIILKSGFEDLIGRMNNKLKEISK